MLKSLPRARKASAARRQLIAVTLVAALLAVLFPTRFAPIMPTAQAVSTTIVISQVYGGAGCGTAGCSTYKNDYIELFNRGTSAVSLNGWSVQYAAATGTAWQTTPLTNVTLQPGQYYLVAEGAGANGVNNIPTPDATGTIAMSGTAAKVALVNTTTALSGSCPTGAQIVDLVGYGSTASCSETAPAPAPSTTTADVRAAAGCTDTDNNSTDFTATTPNPRNTSTALNPCNAGGGGQPSLGINDVSQDEGNSGTTPFTFTVTLSSAAGAGGVTFNWSTADGTATAGSDYTAVSNGSGSIPQGSTSTTVTVNVTGDTTTEPNETFFVNLTNVTGATVTDGQGQGTIVNDDVTITPIYQIQGSGSTSPFNGSTVTTTGVVYGLKSNGFFIQDPTGDGNTSTSDGVFVFTSTAPPAAAAIGNNVRVTATVAEFSPTSDPNQKPLTELTSPTVSTIPGSNTLPAPTTITAADTQVNNLENLEKYEGMRVQVQSMTVVAPTQGNITEASATVSSTGVFFGVVTGVARPFREAGIPISDPLPAGAPANIPRFDENPERLRVDSDAQPGTTAANVSTGAVLANVVGALDYSFRTWTILPETTLTSVNGSATPAPVPTANEFTVASFNIERFFDTTNDPNIGEPVLTTTAFNSRLNKVSLVIRTIQQMPDVIGVQEVENLSTLQAIATKVNNDAVAGGFANPNYQAYLVEGNDVGGIDVGYLVKTSRVTVVDVTQYGKDTTYTNPNNNTQELLNDRPPLVLRASVNRTNNGGTLPFTVIVNHLRSLNGVDDPVDGNRIRTKRRAQAEYLANLIQTFQTNDPSVKLITVGDLNAFRVNDGYVDVIGTILGTPAPADQVVLASPDLVNPDQTDLVDTLTPDQRYSYTFDGNAQTLDHAIVNPNALSILNRFAYARDDADQPVVDYANGNIPDRISDHDQPIAYFSLAGAAVGTGQFIISEFRLRGPGTGNVLAPGTGSLSSESNISVGSEDEPISQAVDTTPEGNDEFIEFYNNTDAQMTISTTDGSSGWALVASDGQTRFVIPNGTVIPARGHFLAINTTGYSLSDYPAGNNGSMETTATGDIPYTLDIPDLSGIALFNTSNAQNFTLANRLDAAGYSAAPALYREGNGFSGTGQEVGNNFEYSFYRDLRSGYHKDTNDNTSDFMSVATQLGVTTSLGTRLGAPGPENLSSPVVRLNRQLIVGYLDPQASASQSPNRVRQQCAQAPRCDPSDSSLGTMSIRRTISNNTGAPVTRLRFRIIDITTYPAPAGTADMRAITSSDIMVMLTNGQTVPVQGTTLEEPPAQPNGGGFNSTLSAGTIRLVTPLQDGQSVNVQFLLGVQQGGSFRFVVNTEALP